MKPFIFITLVLLSTKASSQGYDCEALCIAVESETSQLYVLGKIDVQVGGDKDREALRYLSRKCETRAKKYGLHGAMIVDKLSFSSSNETDSYYNRSHSSSAMISRRYAQMSVYNYTLSVTNQYNTLDADLNPSQAEVACELDAEINDNEKPYVGDLDIL